MKYNFNDIVQRKGSGSMKWERPYILKRFNVDIPDHEDMYPMFIADMDFHLPTEVLSHMHEKYLDPDFGYFHIQDSFYESVVDWFLEKHHMKIEKDWIIPSTGTVTSLHFICDMIARDQNILTMTPIYGPFKNCCEIGHMVTLELDLVDNRYEINFDKLEDILKNKDIKVFLLCNPHNPGGRSWTKEELKRIVLLCKEYHVLLLSDEIHGDFCLGEHCFTSMIEFADLYDDLIVSTSANKTFSISGLSTSYMLCKNEKLRQDYDRYVNRLHISCNRMGIEMIELVYRYGKEWHNELIQVIKNNVQVVLDTMNRLDIQVMKPDAGFLVWVRLDDSIDVEKFILDLAKETHVLLEPGSRFVENYQGWLRINVGTSPILVKEAMERFEQFYRSYRQ